MSRTAIGVFEPSEAERVLDELVSSGYRAEGISLLSHDESGRASARDKPTPEASGPFAGLAGQLLGLHSANLAGIGLAILAGPIAQAVEKSPSSAGESLFVALVEEGVPEGTARAYADEVCRGAALVAIRVADQDLPSALDVLKRHHARSAEEAAAREEAEDIELGFFSEKTRIADKVSDPIDRLEAQADKFDELENLSGESSQRGDASVSPAEQTERASGDMSMPVIEEVIVEKDEVVIEPLATERVLPSVDQHEAGFREHFAEEYGDTGATYQQFSPAYRYGYKLKHHASAQNWTGVEPQAKNEWEAGNPNTWERFKTAIRHAWHKATGKPSEI